MIKFALFIVAAAFAVFQAEGALDSCKLKADVVFLVDSSRSIWRPDYEVQVDFLANLTREMNVGPNGTHVGAVSFSKGARLEFYLNSETNPDRLEDKIRGIPFTQGDVTQTHEGLRMAREQLFNPAHGARSGLPRIMIIVTDGNSRNKTATKMQANLIRQEGILVVAVGIGAMVDRSELAAMATADTPTYVHTVDSFSSLPEANLIPAACNAATTTTTSAPLPMATSEVMLLDEAQDAKDSCAGKMADVVFVLDKSNSITKDNFRVQLNFVNDVIGSFKVSAEHTHVSVVTFAFKSKIEFDLDDYFSASQIKSAVVKIKYTAGATNTHLALKDVAEHVLTPKGGARKGKDVPRVVILVTDGKSSDHGLTKYWAEVLKSKFHAHFFAIGVGEGADYDELRNISSHPFANYTFKVQGFHALQKIKDLLAIRACEVPSGDVFVRCQENAVPSDVMFVTHFAHAVLSDVKDTMELVKEVAAGFMTSDDRVRVGLTSSECAQIHDVTLGEASTAQRFAKAVNLRNRGGLEEALNEARRQVTERREAQRRRVLVLLVHGPISDMKRAQRQLMLARFAKVHVVLVGRGRVVESQLRNLAQAQRRGRGRGGARGGGKKGLPAKKRKEVVVMESDWGEEQEGGREWGDESGGGGAFWQTVLAAVCEELVPGQQIY